MSNQSSSARRVNILNAAAPSSLAMARQDVQRMQQLSRQITDLEKELADLIFKAGVEAAAWAEVRPSIVRAIDAAAAISGESEEGTRNILLGCPDRAALVLPELGQKHIHLLQQTAQRMIDNPVDLEWAEGKLADAKATAAQIDALINEKE